MLRLDEKEISLARDGKKILETKNAEIELVLHEKNGTKLFYQKLRCVF